MGIREKLIKRGVNRSLPDEHEHEKNPFLKSMLFAVGLYAMACAFTVWLLWR